MGHGATIDGIPTVKREEPMTAGKAPADNDSRPKLEVNGTLARWRNSTSLEKFIYYTRFSLQSVVVIVGGLLIFIVGSRFAVPVPFRIMSALYVGLTALIGVCSLEYQPQLNTKTRPRQQYAELLMRLGLGMSIGGLGGFWVAHLIVDSVELQLLAERMVVYSVILVAYCYCPWLPHRWLLTAAITLGSAMLMLSSPTAVRIIVIMAPISFLTAVASEWTARTFKEAEHSRVLEAALKISEERLRFAQELHDTLGQHLAALSIKTEVARALAKRHDPGLEKE